MTSVARLHGLALVLVASTVLTFAMAWPVVNAPSTRIFGTEIVGRHHDPFTMMRQFQSRGAPAPYRQPLIDQAGVALARVVTPAAAFNLLVLLSFPLTAGATYLLARYAIGSPPAAVIAALVFTFAPVRLAHASYHLHIVQTHWLSLYLLALWAFIDRTTWSRGALLVASTAGLALSNLYAGFIGAVITPVALAAYWMAGPPAKLRLESPGNARLGRRLTGLLVPAIVLTAMGLAGLGAVAIAAPDVWAHPERYAFPKSDLTYYGARWWSYLLPAVDHPFFGSSARATWQHAGIGRGLLEQQVSIGWSVLALAAVALWNWRRAEAVRPSVTIIPVLAVVAGLATLCSLQPEPFALLKPSGFLHGLAPMFRSYARFGIVNHLMTAMLAGVGAARLLGSPRETARLLGCALLLLTVLEYAPLPWRSRDVLPTEAHRWLASREQTLRAFDCTPWSLSEESLSWLMHQPLTLLGAPIDTCADPDLPQQLSALGYTHVVLRNNVAAPWPVHHTPGGLELAQEFRDARVYRVTAVKPAVLNLGWRGFFPLEHAPDYRFRWIHRDAGWTVLNTTMQIVRAQLEVELAAFAHPRRMAISFDGRALEPALPPKRVATS